MEDRFLVRQIMTNEGELQTFACTGRKDQDGELVYESDEILFTLPNDKKKRKGTVIYRNDLLTFFVENEEIEEELWKVKIIEVVD